MTVQVRIPTAFRAFTGGAKVIDTTGSTVGEVLEDLFSQHPHIKPRVLDGEKLQRSLNIYLGEDDIAFLESLDTPVQDGQEVSIMAAVAGG